MHREKLVRDLESKIAPSIVSDLLDSYVELQTAHRVGDLEKALLKAGRFVEHALRAIMYICSTKILAEIKSVQATCQHLENQTTLPESLRVLLPRVLHGMVYTVRSKRNAVHVKEIDPSPIDVSLCVSAANWVIAELIRTYHVSEPSDVATTMNSIMHSSIPFVETFDGEVFVGQSVSATVEVLLLLAYEQPSGLTRKQLGETAKSSTSSVSQSLKTLLKKRFVYRSHTEQYFITSQGQKYLSLRLLEINGTNSS